MSFSLKVFFFISIAISTQVTPAPLTMPLQKIAMTQKIFLYTNVKIPTKCITLKFLAKINLSLFNIISCSLDKNFDNSSNLLKANKNDFDIIARTETK